MAILEAVFADKPGQTPQEVERRRKMAQALMESGAGGKPPSSGLELAGRLAMTLMGQYQAGKAEKDDALGRSAANSALINAVYGTSPSSSGSPFTTGAGDAGQTVSGPSKPINMDGNQIYAGFMDTVKAGGVNNPYALAAIAATGKAESGFSPGNANRSWSDPSQSGQAGTAGGIMSWRAERLQNLYNFARAKGEQPGAISPQTQAAFFLQENPALIQRLNSAKSAEEAQRMMNEAWKFAGWDRPGGEAANRLGYANSFLPQFRGQPQQVASLDPSIGMPPQTAAGAVNAMAAGGGAPVSLTDEVAEYEKTPEYAARFPGQNVGGNSAPALPPPVEVAALPVPPNAPALPAAAPQPQGIPAEFAGSRQLANAQGGIIPALMGGSPASPEQIAQARALGAAQPQPQQQDNRALIATLLGNPYTAEAGQQLLMQEMQRRQEASDPMRAMQMEEQRLKLEAMRNPQPDYDIIQDKSTGEVIAVDRNNPTAGPQVIRQGGLPMDAPTTRTIKQPDGSEVAVQWNPEKREWEPLQAPQGGNAVQAIPKLTEQQSKDLVYYQRGEAALQDLDAMEQALTSGVDSSLSQLPLVGNMLVSNDFQQAEQAGRNFLASILRKDTGAAVTASEMDEYGKIFLPRPGDSPETLAQKRQARTEALQAIRSGLGVAERVLQNKQQKAEPVTIDGYTIEEVE